MEEKAESLLLLLDGKVKPSFPYSINMSWGITYINIFEFLNWLLIISLTLRESG